MPEIEIIGPGGSLQIDPVESGFAHGFALFETIALRDGYLEFWEAHWQRLRAAAKHFGLPFRYRQDQVLGAISRLAGAIDGDSVIKLSLVKQADGARLFVYSRPALFRRGQEVGLLVQDVFPINDRSPLAGFKTHNYLESMLAATAAVEAGCYDALRLNTRGFLAEGAVSNLFFSSEGRLMTPSEHTGLLPGVVRAAILEALPVVEGLFTLDQLLRAEAVFLTNSSIGVLPVDFLLHEGSRIDLQSSQHPDAAEIVEACISKRARTCVHP
jgi:branched-subunit amino acid aminotransferase/4-amino-4-deoxychorismate lyase